jgi:hypothetical protein
MGPFPHDAPPAAITAQNPMGTVLSTSTTAPLLAAAMPSFGSVRGSKDLEALCGHGIEVEFLVSFVL